MKIPPPKKAAFRIKPAAHRKFSVIPRYRRRIYLEELSDENLYAVLTSLHGRSKVKVFEGSRLKHGDLAYNRVAIETAGPLKSLKTADEKERMDDWLNAGNTNVMLPKGRTFWAQAVNPRKYPGATAFRLNKQMGWS